MSVTLSRQLASVAAIARADLLERVRRHSYLWTLAVTLYFGYMVNAGQVRLRIAGERGLVNSAWVGTQMALSAGTLLALLGFYLVKNTLDRDRRTGVGEILAATPLARASYTVGKSLSNFLLLASIVVVLAGAAAISQLLAHEEMHLDLLSLVAPMVLLALPPIALSAALAVLFESVRWLRGSFGNVVFFFAWSAGLVLSAMGMGSESDLMGFKAVEHSFARQLPAAEKHQVQDLSLNMGPEEVGNAGDIGDIAPPTPGGAGGKTAAAAATPATPRVARVARRPRAGIRWEGIDWTASVIAGRLIWLALALAVALLAALPFSRFDPAREGVGRRKGSRRKTRSKEETSTATAVGGIGGIGGIGAIDDAVAPAPNAARAPRRPARLPWSPRSRFLVLVFAELQLMLRGRNPWWLLVAAALCVTGLVVPSTEARALLLMLAWIWPLPLWSELGAREKLFGTRPLILAAPLSPGAQCAAVWAAGACLTALTGSGVALRLVLAGDGRGVLAWIAGCLFVPALAIALGTLAGSPRLFEIVYLLLWYTGPLNHVATLDYTGLGAATRQLPGPPGLPAVGTSWIFATLAAGLFGVAWAARVRQTRD